MNRTRLALSVVAASLTVCTTLLFAQDTKQHKPTTPITTTAAPAATTPPESQLPPGMTPEMMQAATEAGTPGPMHAYLCENAGEWIGDCNMWMGPNTPAMKSTLAHTVTPILGGRFTREDTVGDMGEWGKFEGTGTFGYDIAKCEFLATWADTMSTGMMYGTGQLSSDHCVLTINYNYYCPMQKKDCAFKQTVTRNDDGTQTMRMWANAIGTGEEYKMMETIYTRKSQHKHPHAKPATHATHNDKAPATN